MVGIGQPILSVFGESPEQFVFRRASAFDVIGFVLVVVGLPALTVWGLLVMSRRLGSVASALRGVVVGSALCLFAVQLVAGAGASLPVAWIAGAAMVAGGTVTAISGRHLVEDWARWLSLVAPVAVGAFLLSPSGDLIELGEAAVGFGGASDTPDVVMIVLDELPTGTLLDESGQIDRDRYPNLAGLADRSTWYRRFTSPSGQTKVAVPAALTGEAPGGELARPLWTAHPDNLFTLLAESHHIVAQEPLTRLCPPTLCAAVPTPPPGTGGRGPVSPSRIDIMLSLLGDAWTVLVDRLAGREGADLGGFSEEVTASFRLEGLAPDLSTQPESVAGFLDAAQASPEPVLYFGHFVLPHQPWQFTETGRRYSVPGPGGPIQNPWLDQWAALVNAEAHLRQTEYADALVGLILDTLDERGVLDEAVVVVMGDHGFNFDPSSYGRYPIDREDAPALMTTPLLVSLPGQAEARTSDHLVQAQDLLGLIEGELGRDLDARAEPDLEGREEVEFVRYSNPLVGVAGTQRWSFRGDEIEAALVPPLLGGDPQSDLASLAHPEGRRLLGAELSAIRVGPPPPDVSAVWIGWDGAGPGADAGLLAVQIVGGGDTEDADSSGSEPSVAAVVDDDRVIGLSPTFTSSWLGADPELGPMAVVPVPSDRIGRLGDELSVWLVDEDGGLAGPLPIGVAQ